MLMLEERVANRQIATKAFSNTATNGGDAVTIAAWSSVLAIKYVQNPWLTLNQLSPWAEVTAASAMQRYHKLPGPKVGLGSLRAEQQHSPSLRYSGV